MEITIITIVIIIIITLFSSVSLSSLDSRSSSSSSKIEQSWGDREHRRKKTQIRAAQNFRASRNTKGPSVKYVTRQTNFPWIVLWSRRNSVFFKEAKLTELCVIKRPSVSFGSVVHVVFTIGHRIFVFIFVHESKSFCLSVQIFKMEQEFFGILVRHSTLHSSAHKEIRTKMQMVHHSKFLNAGISVKVLKNFVVWTCFFFDKTSFRNY
jgi:hypothetical protein